MRSAAARDDELDVLPDYDPRAEVIDERALWAGVLQQAVEDATAPRYATASTPDERDRVKKSARRWFRSDAVTPGSFLWVLRALELPGLAGAIRRKVLGGATEPENPGCPGMDEAVRVDPGASWEAENLHPGGKPPAVAGPPTAPVTSPGCGFGEGIPEISP